ncbi:MAG: ATP-binding protein [Rhizobiaceae bacterium]|nr:ATP-binding protein [Rhizobiaceae bacterium]
MRAFYTLIFAILIGGISAGAYFVAFDRFEKSATQNSTDRLSLYQAGLRSTLERVSHLPKVVALHPNTREVLRQGKSIAGFNDYLKSVNNEAGAAALYLLDKEGTTVAASNYDNEESFVGNNYQFRRYFTDAIENGDATFFAVGVTTGRPGYFLSEAIRDGANTLGVAVVKVEFTELLQYWEEAREDVVITNADGVVVLASNSSRLYKTIRPISQTRQEEMIASRKFASFQIEPLMFTSGDGKFQGRIDLAEQAFSLSSADTAATGWRLHFLTPLDSVHASALASAMVAFLLCGLTAIGILYFRSRLERTKLGIIASEAERVREVNVRLEEEVRERKRTEHQLRETQAELIQSSRLAALGKMSAAIVHEVNQPVSAIRTYTSSGKLLLDKKRSSDAKDVFGEIAKMTERLGAITSDLLVFSRKPVSKPKNVDLNIVISQMVKERLLGIESDSLRVELDLWQRPLNIKGSQHRFEQLVSNLLQNAMQACEASNPGLIEITTLETPTAAHIIISDNGHGVPEDIIDQLFDPFFTTKGVGKGVGLGLALSYAIVDEAGGRIRCENRDEGGARFVVELPFEHKASNKIRQSELGQDHA